MGIIATYFSSDTPPRTTTGTPVNSASSAVADARAVRGGGGRAERADPAVAVPARAAFGQVGASLHLLDGQQLGVQDVRPRRGKGNEQ